ncbi:MAG: hypothetical protein NT118_14325 [Lentisphaerae bacterium]|nr:hypothetical protein [Lentisphaerota bacterium]
MELINIRRHSLPAGLGHDSSTVPILLTGVLVFIFFNDNQKVLRNQDDKLHIAEKYAADKWRKQPL